MNNKIKLYLSFIPVALLIWAIGYTLYFCISFWFSPEVLYNLSNCIKFIFYNFYNYLISYKDQIDDWIIQFWYHAIVWLLSVYLWIIIFTTILSILKIIFILPFEIIFNRKKFQVLTKTYKKFIKHYLDSNKYYDVFNTNKLLIIWLIFLHTIPTKWEKRWEFVTLHEDNDLLKRTNKDFKEKINESCYVYEILINTTDIKRFIIWSDIPNHKLKKIIESNYEELSYDLEENKVTTEKSKDNKVIISITSSTNWKTIEHKKVNKEALEEKLKLWFYNSYNSWWLEIKDYALDFDSINHACIIWSTQKWKDVLTRNFITNILKNISTYNNSILHFFDTKWSDWEFINWLESYDIYRHSNKDKFPEILDNIQKEIDKRQARLWLYPNIKKYNQNNSKKMKNIFLIINEFLDISTFSNSNEIYSKMISLWSKGASVWLHIILLTQSVRKDSHKMLWAILVNISDYFVLSTNNDDERKIIWKWLSHQDKEILKNKIEYNCLHIWESKIKQEFRAYLMEQVILRPWIEETFKIEKMFKDEKINSYYNYVIKNKTFIRKEAFEDFELNEKAWNKVKEKLKEQDLIEEVAWKGYIFKD